MGRAKRSEETGKTNKTEMVEHFWAVLLNHVAELLTLDCRIAYTHLRTIEHKSRKWAQSLSDTLTKPGCSEHFPKLASVPKIIEESCQLASPD